MSDNMLSVSHKKEVNLATGNIENSVFVKVYRTMFESGLVAKIGATNFTTLMALSIHMNEKGECFPTQERLADMIGVHKNTVNKYINQLLEITFEGQPLVTRNKVNKGMGKIQSFYKIHPISQVAIFNGVVKNLDNPKNSDFVNHKSEDTSITNACDESIPTWCDVTRNNKQETNNNINIEVAPLNSNTGLKLFQSVYREVYGVNYVIGNYGRDGKTLKDKVITPYPELAGRIIETAIREYAARWKNPKYPRPSVAMFSWVTNQVIEIIEKDNELTEIALHSEEREQEAEKDMLSRLELL